ncbi:MAG TPA: glycoside hydrolase family 172 protein, partial [Acidimicrobiales bacterium]
MTAVVVALGWSGPAWGAAQPVQPRPGAALAASPAPNKGPVGWNVYRQLDRMAEIPVGTDTRSFSSFDRTGGNSDLVGSGAKCLSTSQTGCLIASHDGAGEIDSIWFTAIGPAGLGDVSPAGNLVVQLDGQTPVNYPLESLVEGKLNAPFVYPLVADRFQSSGGVYIKVPMSFQRSMRVYTSNAPVYYHLDYRVFSDSVGVTTFDPTDRATDVLAMLDNAGKADPKPNAPAPPPPLPFSVLPGTSTTLATEVGPGSISALQLSLDALQPGARAASQTAAPTTAGHEVSGAVQLPLDPTNQGAHLVYQGPPGTTPQSAPLLVDGQPVGSFSGPVGGGGVTQTLDLPPGVTAGKSRAALEDLLLVPGSTLTATSLRGGRPVRSDVVHPALVNGQSPTVNSVTPQTSSLLSGLRVRLSFDGQQTVDLPVGEFFASPLDGSPVSSLLTAVQSGSLSSWYLMPYASGATVQLYNGSNATVTGSSSVAAAPSTTWTTALAAGGGSGYFRAQSHQADTTAGADFPLLDQPGGGKLIGISLAMRGASPGRLFLEGDERFALDGSRTPQEQGTGTEDLFEGGWYFSNGSFSAPFNGLVSQQSATTGCANECLSAYRLFVADSVPFHAAAHLSIEHGNRDESAANYDATAYMYAQTNPSVRVTGAVDVGQAASEQQANFSVAGNPPATPLTATFEGPFDTVPLASVERSGGGATTFTLPADPAAASVTIRRTTDQFVAGQAADVFVNGSPAGRWSEPLGNTSSRWLDDEFRLPPALTNGSSALNVRIVPV